MHEGNNLLCFPYSVCLFILYLYHVACVTWSFPVKIYINNGVHSQELSPAVPESSEVISLAVSEGPALLKAL